MIKILLVCAGGMSTSILAQNMQKEAENKGMEVKIWAAAESNTKEESKDVDVILVGPQMRFKVPVLKKAFPDIPIIAIEMQDYGMMDGKAALEAALKQVNV